MNLRLNNSGQPSLTAYILCRKDANYNSFECRHYSYSKTMQLRAILELINTSTFVNDASVI